MSVLTSGLSSAGITGGMAGGAAGGLVTAVLALRYVKTTYYDPLSPVEKRKLHKMILKSPVVVAAEVALDSVKRCLCMRVLTKDEKRTLELVRDLEAQIEQAKLNMKQAENEQLHAAEEVGSARVSLEEAQSKGKEVAFELENLSHKEEILESKKNAMTQQKALADSMLARLTELKSGEWKKTNVDEPNLNEPADEIQSEPVVRDVELGNLKREDSKEVEANLDNLSVNPRVTRKLPVLPEHIAVPIIPISNQDEERRISQKEHEMFSNNSSSWDGSDSSEGWNTGILGYLGFLGVFSGSSS